MPLKHSTKIWPHGTGLVSGRYTYVYNAAKPTCQLLADPPPPDPESGGGREDGGREATLHQTTHHQGSQVPSSSTYP